jgi:hypothetical protein
MVMSKRKKKVHAHFVGQAPEGSDCRFRVSEILKEKNVGENAGGVQVDEKELTVAKVANGETEQFDEHNNQNAQWVDAKNVADMKGVNKEVPRAPDSWRSRENSRTKLV